MKNLDKMTVAELEQRTYELTAQRGDIRKQAMDVQAMLSIRLDEQRVSQLLGRNVQLVDVEAIESGEAVD